MTPILYAKTETQWTSNGLGRLSDASSCVVTEERNGIFELEMEYPMTGVHFSDIQVDCFIKTICSAKKNAQLFRVYSITKPINGKCRIYAHHVSYQMLLIPVMPFTAVGAAATLQALKANSIGDCPFTFYTDNDSERRFRLDYPKSMRGALQGDQWSILQNFGGDYEWDNWTVRLLVQRGQDKGVVLRYGKNIIDMKQEENIQQTYTGILPYWYGMEGEEQVLVTLPERVLYADTAANFPYSRILPVDFTDQMLEKPTEADLRAQGLHYIDRNEIGIPAVTITLNFVDLSQTEEYKNLSVETLNLCDVINVEFSELGISKKAKITRTTYDVLRERYTKLYIGENYHSIATLISQQNVETTEVVTATRNKIAEAINQQTQVINGNIDGSSMKTLTDQDGNPRGFVILDTYSESTATNCIRANINGIGFSTSGPNGPYDTAIYYDSTLDKWVVNSEYLNVVNINASNITSGTISANKISGGTIDASDVTITNLNASNITSGTISANKVSGGTLSGSQINIGNGTFKVDSSGNVTANSLSSNNANITGGSINMQTSSSTQDKIILSYSPFQTNISPGSIKITNTNLDTRLTLANSTINLEGDLSSGGKSGFSVTNAGTLSLSSPNGTGRVVLAATNNSVTLYDSNHIRRVLLNDTGLKFYDSSGTSQKTYGASSSSVDVDEVWSGTFSNGSSAVTVTNGATYKILILQGDASSGGSRITLTIPVASLSTSDIGFQLADETNFIAVNLKKSGNNVIMSSRAGNNTGRILNIYGIN